MREADFSLVTVDPKYSCNTEERILRREEKMKNSQSKQVGWLFFKIQIHANISQH